MFSFARSLITSRELLNNIDSNYLDFMYYLLFRHLLYCHLDAHNVSVCYSVMRLLVFVRYVSYTLYKDEK